METTKILSFSQFAQSLLQKFYPSRNLRGACYKNFILRAICAELAAKILSSAQIARSLLQKFYPPRNLREACYKNFILLANCAKLATKIFSWLKNENTLIEKMASMKNKTDMKHVKTRLIASLLQTCVIRRRQVELQNIRPGQLHPVFFIRE